MSRAAATIAYDGPALRGGVMDVRDLAPALLAVGQLLDAANIALNGDDSKIQVRVKATGTGSFEIDLEVIQSLSSHLISLFSSESVSAAANLVSLVLGKAPAAICLIWLVQKLRGDPPDQVEVLSESMVKLTIGRETLIVPLNLLRLYQDMAVRTAVQKLVQEPLSREGIDLFEVRENREPIVSVRKADASSFTRPVIADEMLIDDVRRSAYSIISLAFKEDNKWRLNDGTHAISALIADEAFLEKVDANQVSFSKGDILICDVRVTQTQTEQGLKTDYIVVKVVDHRPGSRQLPLPMLTTAPTPEPGGL